MIVFAFFVKKTSGILFFGLEKENSGSFLNQKNESRKSPISYSIEMIL